MATITTYSDADRVRMATRNGSTWIGPVETHECPRHPGHTESWRWFWTGERKAIEHGDTECVRSCLACNPSDEDEG